MGAGGYARSDLVEMWLHGVDAHAYEVAPQKILGLVDFGTRSGIRRR